MELIVLGSGTCIPSNYRASPSLLLMANNQPVLFDMGPGTLRQLTRVGINHDKIGRIFLTHFHPDHTADLIHFLFATRDPSTLERRKPFTITGPMGFKNLLNNLQKAYGKWLDIPSEIMKIEELDTKKQVKRRYNNLNIISNPVKHTPHSLAYRVENEAGKSFVYSGDTDLCDEIVELAKDSDLLILECSFPDGKEMEGHLTPSRAGQIASLAKTNKLMLIHFYPEVLTTDIARDCRKTYAGELVLGRDLLHINV